MAPAMSGPARAERARAAAPFCRDSDSPATCIRRMAAHRADGHDIHSYRWSDPLLDEFGRHDLMGLDDFSPDEIRSAEEVAWRTLALFAVWGLTTNADRTDVLQWIDEAKLRSALTPNEFRMVDAPALTERQAINLSWESERLIVLLWALNLIDDLPPADEQCDTSVFKCLPPFSSHTVGEFVGAARLRSESELRHLAQTYFDLHAEARSAELNGRPPRAAVDIEVIQERHRAINWITGYEGLDWDNLTTDT